MRADDTRGKGLPSQKRKCYCYWRCPQLRIVRHFLRAQWEKPSADRLDAGPGSSQTSGFRCRGETNNRRAEGEKEAKRPFNLAWRRVEAVMMGPPVSAAHQMEEFGKAGAVANLSKKRPRVASVDSMAWNYAARREAFTKRI
jgi:hypothetical protein